MIADSVIGTVSARGRLTTSLRSACLVMRLFLTGMSRSFTITSGPVASTRAGLIGMNERKLASPDLASPRFKADPYPFYARLRAEAPVWRTTLPDKRTAWLVTRYEDVAGVLKDDWLAKDPLDAMDPEQL